MTRQCARRTTPLRWEAAAAANAQCTQHGRAREESPGRCVGSDTASGTSSSSGSAYHGRRASCCVPAAISATIRPIGSAPVNPGASDRASTIWTSSIAAQADGDRDAGDESADRCRQDAGNAGGEPEPEAGGAAAQSVVANSGSMAAIIAATKTAMPVPASDGGGAFVVLEHRPEDP